jgi:two-component system cell cycle sensor histidine kinase/response regulator CckA
MADRGQRGSRRRAEAVAPGRSVAALAADDAERLKLLESLHEGIWAIGPDNLTTFVNGPMAEMLGYTPDEMVGRDLFSYMDGANVKLALEYVERRRAGVAEQHEFKFQTKSGRDLFVIIETSPIVDEHGEYAGAIAAVLDTTEHKLAELALRESRATLVAALASMSDAVFVTDVSGNLLEFNDAFVTYHRFKDRAECFRDLAGCWALLDIWHTETGRRAEPEESALPRALRGETASGVEYTLTRRDTGETWIGSYNFAPIRDAKGMVAGAVVSVRDVSDRKREEVVLSLRAELAACDDLSLDEYLQKVLDAEHLTGSAIGFFHFVDPDGDHLVLQTWSTNTLRTACAAEGKGRHYPVSEAGVWVDSLRLRQPVIHNDYAALSHKKGLPAGHAAIVREAVVPIERDGRVVCIMGVGNKPADYTQRDVELLQALASVVADSVIRRHVEAKLRASEDQYQRLFESMSEGVAYCQMLYDENGAPCDWVYLMVNQAFCEHTGLRDIVGKRVTEAIPTIREATPDLFETYARVAQTGHPERFEIDFTPLGKWFEVAVYSPERGFFVALFNDMTERRLVEEQLRQSQKMEAVGQLAGGIAHDFNNLLGVILGYSDLMLADPRLAAYPALDDLKQVQKAAERASTLTKQILAFSRRQALRPAVISLNEVAAQMEPLLRRTLREDINLRVDLDPGLDSVEADPHQLQEVIMNLVLNSCGAMPTGGTLVIATANVTVKEESALATRVSPGKYAVLSVSDDGAGMNAAVRERMFEPFFTTKEPGVGTGLGLSVVYGVVKQSRGGVEVDSEPGRGTTVSIYLPRAVTYATASASPERVMSLPLGTETIFVIEDEPALRALISRTLHDLGYRVMEAGSALEALNWARAATGAVDLLLTDVVLPGAMQGEALSKEILSLFPGIPVVFMSGYTRESMVHSGRLDEGVTLIEKPFKLEDLMAAIRRELDRGR